MSNLMEHFERELKILQENHEPKEDNKLVIEDFIPTIREIIKIFSEQGHSGASAPFYYNYLSHVIKNTLAFLPLSSITGDDSEWNECSGGDFQNTRCSAIFKKGKKGEPYYLNAIVWKGEESYDTFTGMVEDVKSRQFLKFPFTPKTFYIDVRREEYNEKKHGKDADYVQCGTGDFLYFIKDRNQLKEVAEHYEMNQ